MLFRSCTPIVSIIVTVYKRTDYLLEALKSALAQQYTSIEIIVTDDSNSPDIKTITESLNSPFVTYRSNINTLGVVLNLKAAVTQAKGKYIAILNDDDCWEPEFLSELVMMLESNPGCVLAFSDHWIINENSQINAEETEVNTDLYGRRELPGGEVSNSSELLLMKNGIPLAMAAVFRKDAVDWSELVTDVSGAYDFWLSCLLISSGKICYVPKRLTRYRVHSQSETARKSPDKNMNMVYIYKNLLRIEKYNEFSVFIKQKLSFYLYYVGKEMLFFDNCVEARKFLYASLIERITLKSLVLIVATVLPFRIRMELKVTKSN